MISERKMKAEECDSEKRVNAFNLFDPRYHCAVRNITDDTIIFYLHNDYSIWNKMVTMPWILVCGLLCTISILIGGPMLYILRKDRREEKRRQRGHS